MSENDYIAIAAVLHARFIADDCGRDHIVCAEERRESPMYVIDFQLYPFLVCAQLCAMPYVGNGSACESTEHSLTLISLTSFIFVFLRPVSLRH